MAQVPVVPDREVMQHGEADLSPRRDRRTAPDSPHHAAGWPGDGDHVLQQARTRKNITSGQPPRVDAGVKAVSVNDLEGRQEGGAAPGQHMVSSRRLRDVPQPGLQIADFHQDSSDLGALIDRARRGSTAAFAQLVALVHGPVRRWARRLTGDPDDADDIAQLVLLRLYERIDEFEGRSRLTTWLYRVTRNIALSRRRTRERRAALLARSAPPSHVEPEVPAPDPARIGALVRLHAASLSARQREVFDLADLQGIPTAEVAARLGVEPVTVRVTLMKARRAIRLRMLEAHPELLEEFEP
jgi:RNA polymerase sigma-70 factor (ECF subfamily)